MILPKIKSIKEYEQSYLLPFDICICGADKYEEKVQKLFELFFPESKVAFGEAGNVVITDNGDDTEKYSLNVTTKGVEICCGNYLALRNALATLSLMAKPHPDGFLLTECEISDLPTCGFRGIMLDLARGAKPYDMLIEDIILCGKLKYNVLHLHLFDSEGLCVKLDSVPEVCCVENFYSKEQMRYVVQLADVLGLEIIPEWDMPGHSSSLFKGIDGMECDIPEDTQRFVWAACVGKEKTYKVYETIINELVDLFPGKYFHIGGDEVHFEDGRPYGYICHWMECADCKKVMEREGLSDIFDLYNYFILRIYDIVKKTGRTMMMWSDWVDCTKGAVIPKDVVMQFWRVASEGRGPYIDSSMNNQLRLGYKVINCYYEDTYFCNELYISSQRLPGWHWLESPEVDENLKENIIGSVGCCWEYGNQKGYPHYGRTFAPTAVLFADKLWNGDKGENYNSSEYRIAVNRTIFGINTPEGIEVFNCVGDVIPPREVFPRFIFARTVLPEIAYFERINCTAKEVYKVAEQLKNMENSDKFCAVRIKYFANFLDRIAEKIIEKSQKSE